MIPSYAELHCLTNFSFLRGASDPEELVHRASSLGYRALAITDECSVAGVVRAHVAAKDAGLKLIIGTELVLSDRLKLVLLATNIRGYETMCELITKARRAAPKGEYLLHRTCVPVNPEGLQALWIPPAVIDEKALDEGRWISRCFPGNAWIAIELLRGSDDEDRALAIEALGRSLDLRCIASGDVHMHTRKRKRLQDVMTAIRLRCQLAEAGRKLYPNGERHLRAIGRLSAIHSAQHLAASLDLASRCSFSLDEIRYEYPEELVPEGETPTSHLRHLTMKGLARRYPEGAAGNVIQAVEHELKLIAELAYEPFFLTVNDIVEYARSEKILCQGRGSAANSAVCYCLGITEVDPGRMSVLFERFISKERNERPISMWTSSTSAANR